MKEIKYLEKIGFNIANARKKMNLTQKEFYEKTGFDRSSLARIESGKVNSSIVKLKELADLLGVTVGELVD